MSFLRRQGVPPNETPGNGLLGSAKILRQNLETWQLHNLSMTKILFKPLRMIGKSIEIHTKPRSLKRQHHFPRIQTTTLRFSQLALLPCKSLRQVLQAIELWAALPVSPISWKFWLLKVCVNPNYWEYFHGFLPQQIGPRHQRYHESQVLKHWGGGDEESQRKMDTQTARKTKMFNRILWYHLSTLQKVGKKTMEEEFQINFAVLFLNGTEIESSCEPWASLKIKCYLNLFFK